MRRKIIQRYQGFFSQACDFDCLGLRWARCAAVWDRSGMSGGRFGTFTMCGMAAHRRGGPSRVDAAPAEGPCGWVLASLVLNQFWGFTIHVKFISAHRPGRPSRVDAAPTEGRWGWHEGMGGGQHWNAGPGRRGMEHTTDMPPPIVAYPAKLIQTGPWGQFNHLQKKRLMKNMNYTHDFLTFKKTHNSAANHMKKIRKKTLLGLKRKQRGIGRANKKTNT